MKISTILIACLLIIFMLLSSCSNHVPSLSEQIVVIKDEISKIEAQCVPKKNTPKEEVELIFGDGQPLPLTVSKLPQNGPIPYNSPRRAYKLCDDGLLTVRYDSEWKVLHASYANPFSTKGRPSGMKPSNEELIRELEPRLIQMKKILNAYNQRKAANKILQQTATDD